MIREKSLTLYLFCPDFERNRNRSARDKEWVTSPVSE